MDVVQAKCLQVLEAKGAPIAAALSQSLALLLPVASAVSLPYVPACAHLLLPTSAPNVGRRWVASHHPLCSLPAQATTDS